MREDLRMQEVLWASVCAVLTAAIAAALVPTLRVPALLRTNYAGRDVPTAGGVCVLVAFAVTVALAVTTKRHGYGAAPEALLVAVGFGALGLFDDVVGTHAARGWRGHVNALRRGQLTSGLVKLVGGVTLAWIVGQFAGDRLVDHVVATVIVAGCANAANLFDLAPARATKVAALVIIVAVLLHGGLGPGSSAVWFVAGAAALVPFELRESLMLGDTGANALGAIVGYALLFTGPASRLGIAIAVVAVNIAGELVSFSSVIDRVAPLRALDRLGRRG